MKEQLVRWDRIAEWIDLALFVGSPIIAGLVFDDLYFTLAVLVLLVLRGIAITIASAALTQFLVRYEPSLGRDEAARLHPGWGERRRDRWLARMARHPAWWLYVRIAGGGFLMLLPLPRIQSFASFGLFPDLFSVLLLLVGLWLVGSAVAGLRRRKLESERSP